MVLERATVIPTIDVNLVTVTTKGESPKEYALDTATEIAVEPQIEVTEAVKLIIKGKLIAQKREDQTLTGNTITLTDNVFTPELVQILQGGTITKDIDGNITGYKPPVAGASKEERGEEFTLNAYTAQYNAAGLIVQYEKISYPNCLGAPVAMNIRDGEFRVNEYTIISAPDVDEEPYEITYQATLPTVTETEPEE